MVTDKATVVAIGALLFISLSATGCHHSTEGGVRMEQVIAAFDKSGWKASELRSTDPGRMSALKCVEGTLAGVEALICEYGGAEAVTQGKKAAESWVANAVTGVALSNGRTVLGLADRGRTDPLGKSTHEVSRAYLAIQ